MNRSIFRRIFWKEYRLQRPLWLAMLALTAMLMLLLREFPIVSDWGLVLFQIAVGLPAMYLLGSAASLFAGEREAETYEFQRSLPVKASTAFVAKTAFTVASGAALLAVACLLAILLGGRLVGNPLPILAVLGFFGIEIYLWAVFYSLLLSRVLSAAILGVATASVVTNVIVFWITRFHGGIDATMYLAAMPWRIVVVGLVAAADAYLGIRWFHERDRKAVRSRAEFATSSTEDRAEYARLSRPHRMTMLGRLVWQHWRQSLGTMGLIVLLIVAVMVPASLVMADIARIASLHIDIPIFHPRIFGPTSISLLGLCVFLADQRRHGFRFLADRGVSPGHVWWSRQIAVFLIPLLILIILMFVGMVFVGTHAAQRPPNGPAFLEHSESGSRLLQGFAQVMAIPTYLVIGVAVGQLCSMFVRSGVLAGVFAVLLMGIMTAWCELMSFWRIHWLWSVWPIVLALFVATWLRTPWWLLERNTWRTWRWPILTCVVPMLVLVAAVPLYRIYSVPAVEPIASVEKFTRAMTPEEQQTLEWYAQAADSVVGYGPDQRLENDPVPPSERRWATENAKAIALAMKASRGPLFNPTGTLPTKRPMSFDASFFRLGRLLTYDGVRLAEAGDLAAAFERYAAALRVSLHLQQWQTPPSLIRRNYNPPSYDGEHIEELVYSHLLTWAARPNQTADRLVAAAEQVAQMTRDASLIQGVELAYWRVQRFLAGDAGATSTIEDSYDEFVPPMTLWWLGAAPWERQRAVRLVNLVARRGIETLSQAEQASISGRQVAYPSLSLKMNAWNPFFDESTPYALNMEVNIPPVLFDVRRIDLIAGKYATLETSRRATRLALRLKAWQLQHGSLPPSLHELLAGKEQRIAIDPWSGQWFRYFPDGLKSALSWKTPRTGRYQPMASGTLEPGSPLLWSTGPRVSFNASSQARTILDRYQIVGEAGGSWYWRHPDSECDLWTSGWAFPIPTNQ